MRLRHGGSDADDDVELRAFGTVGFGGGFGLNQRNLRGTRGLDLAGALIKTGRHFGGVGNTSGG